MIPLLFLHMEDKLKLLKTYNNTNNTKRVIYSYIKKTIKKCKCSLCNKKVSLAYETQDYAINHNFCLKCVEKNFIKKKR